MGIGVSLAFIALGAILAFALNVDMSGVNIQMVGWILMLVGLASMAITFGYTRPRRRAAQLVEQPYGSSTGETALREETVVEEAPVTTERVVVDRPTERIVERPVQTERVVREEPVEPTIRPAQDPRMANDPAIANDPGRQHDPGFHNPPSSDRRR
ncbi:DUF6458 family protein [Actinomadura flavalba]|uniref:DUF6458 family protein n=1 Tax=Actinomadura flavalba TaxID=1120938 RepID=UPI0003648355|nr:DUF6458 family protein [Actinomadura flavalba]